jgi:ABC-type multidrug transport system fused ATPase/permease subunit
MLKSASTLRWVLVCLRPYSRPLTILGSLSIAEISLRVLAPWPLKAIVDRLIAARTSPEPITGSTASGMTILAIAGIGLLLQLTHQLVMLYHTRLQMRIGQRIVFDTQSRLFAQLQYLSLGHHDRVPTSDAIYRVNNDAASLEHLILRSLFPMAFSVLTLVSMLVVLIRIEPTLALISMAVVPVLYAGLRVHMRRVHRRSETAKALESALLGRTLESLAAIRLVKAFAREEYELNRFTGAAQKAMQERFSVARLESLFSFVVGTVTISGTSLVLAVGAMYVAQGRITVGTLLVVMAYLGFVYGPLSAIATTTGSLQHALAGLKRVREVLALPPETDPTAGRFCPGPLAGAITFDNVSFRYPGGRDVLREVSFTARPGETIALVGPSGAGKTTLVSLLGRMHEPTEGRILIDGINIRDMRLKWLREQIAVVLQEAVLFSGTIADNIRYGQLHADEDAVIRAARAAHAEDFILKTEHGFDTMLKESGTGLSVGQRQRLSIARAFLKDAPVLILDEPTAALDTITERQVLSAMRELRRNRTTFVIAHRMSSVRDADRILVLEAGRIIAEGPHEDLLRSCPLYARLCARLVADKAGTSAVPA